jgi:glutamyl-tRNA synthetase
MEYEKQGYLPEAMFNFLALLGWGTGSNDELFTKDELIARFNLEGISGGNAVFNTEKLDWFNHQHLLGLPDGELAARIDTWQAAHGSGLWALGSGDGAWVSRVLALLRPRCKKLTDFADQLAPFFVDPASYDADGVKKHLGAPEMPGHLMALREVYAALPTWDEAALEACLRGLAEARGVKAAALIHGTRLAMTGRMVSPGLFEMLVLLGRERVIARADALVDRLRA